MESVLKQITDKYFPEDSQILKYQNDTLFLKADKEYISQYEICVRNGNTLAVWMEANEFTLNELVPYMARDYDFITEEVLNNYFVLAKIHSEGLLQIVINFDKYNKRFRVYFLHDGELVGYDIEVDGKISKKKVYKLSTEYEIVTFHSSGKITKAHKIPTEYGFELIRNDEQKYYTYFVKKGLKWQY